MNYNSIANKRLSELEKCRKELKRREINYGTSDSSEKNFEIEIEKYYEKIEKLFEIARRANQCQLNTQIKIDENQTTIGLLEPTQLFFKTIIYNKQNPNKKDYSVSVWIKRSEVLSTNGSSNRKPPTIQLDWHKDKTEIGDHPFEEALYVFEKYFPKFEKFFFRYINKMTKQLKKKLKKENRNDKKRNNKKTFGCP